MRMLEEEVLESVTFVLAGLLPPQVLAIPAGVALALQSRSALGAFATGCLATLGLATLLGALNGLLLDAIGFDTNHMQMVPWALGLGFIHFCIALLGGPLVGVIAAVIVKRRGKIA